MSKKAQSKAGKKTPSVSTQSTPARLRESLTKLSSEDWRAILQPQISPTGHTLYLEFDVPSEGLFLYFLGTLGDSLYRISAELFGEPEANDDNDVIPGAYVTWLRMSSPLRININFPKIPEGAVEAFASILDKFLFYRQTARLKDAEAKIRMEAAKRAYIDNVAEMARVARQLRKLDGDEQASVGKIIDAVEDLEDSTAELQQVRLIRGPLSDDSAKKAQTPRRRSSKKTKHRPRQRALKPRRRVKKAKRSPE
jgi:hypothetical protein